MRKLLLLVSFRMAETSKARYQILVVDDEPTVCKAIQMMLRYYGHEVQTAADGQAALAAFEAGKFDLVITDYLMPEMKGDQLVSQIKQSRPDQRIIMVTAFAEDFLARGKPTGGVDMVLNKPFSLDELRAAIAKVMDGMKA
jgi:CheY-like chemotaxis protein